MTKWPLFLSGEIPGQRCYRSRRNRGKHVLHYSQRRGKNSYLTYSAYLKMACIYKVYSFSSFSSFLSFPFRSWWLRMWMGIRSRCVGWEKGNILGNRPLYGNHGNRTHAWGQLSEPCITSTVGTQPFRWCHLCYYSRCVLSTCSSSDLMEIIQTIFQPFNHEDLLRQTFSYWLFIRRGK